MLYHSVYGEIVATWTWGGAGLNVASFLLFAGSLIWHLVIISRHRRALKEIRTSLPPIRTEWVEMTESRSDDNLLVPNPFVSSLPGEVNDEVSQPHDSQPRVPHRRLPWVLLHLSFGLFMASLCFWPWVYVAFDLMEFYVGLVVLWAIVAVAWIIASGPSLFHVLLDVYASTHDVDEPLLVAEGGRTSPTSGRARAASSTLKNVSYCLWAYSLQQKLTGTPSYEVLKGDKDMKVKPRWHRTRWGRLLVFYGGLCALLFFAWFFLFATCSMCITDHPVEFSTRFTRSFSPPTCGVNNGTLCHVYVMPPYDGAREMIVNVVLLGARGDRPVHVHYDPAPKGDKGSLGAYQYVTTASAVTELPLPVGEGPRYSQAILLSKLTPDTVYHFVVSVASGAEISASFSFRTLPAYGEVPIVIGGDSGTEPGFAQLLDVVSKRDTRLVVVAGDISYANGLRSCYRRWDEWLAIWHKHMKTVEGHLMPIITSIGNHDVGPGGYGTFWSGLFVQNKQALTAVRWQDRQTYHAHLISNHTLLMVLDTGHVVEPANQVPWMENVLSSHADLPNKLAAYHIPLYPSRRSYSDPINIDLRQHWLPVFDQHKLDVGFEHHDHSYKRTKKLKGGQPNANGTLYLGDGCFGVPAKPFDVSRPYLEKASATEHGFFIKLAEQKLDIEAFDTTGHIFDHVTLP